MDCRYHECGHADDDGPNQPPEGYSFTSPREDWPGWDRGYDGILRPLSGHMVHMRADILAQCDGKTPRAYGDALFIPTALRMKMEQAAKETSVRQCRDKTFCNSTEWRGWVGGTKTIRPSRLRKVLDGLNIPCPEWLKETA